MFTREDLVGYVETVRESDAPTAEVLRRVIGSIRFDTGDRVESCSAGELNNCLHDALRDDSSRATQLFIAIDRFHAARMQTDEGRETLIALARAARHDRPDAQDLPAPCSEAALKALTASCRAGRSSRAEQQAS